MPRHPFPPTAVVISFIDRINHGDLDGLVALMADDHTLAVLGEKPVVGRNLNRDAWRGYFSLFPDYVIYPRYLTTAAGMVAVLGTTTGSHLGLADEDEMKLNVIWLVEVSDEKVALWRIAQDTVERRAEFGIPAMA